jgi:hypothetical protein
MANEGKDGLFDMNLGEGLIDIPDTVPAAEVETPPVVVPTVEDNAGTDKEETPVVAHKEHDDGMIEIDEALQATINAGQIKETDENDETIIETIESKEKKKTPSGDGSGDSSPSSSQYLAFAKDRASEGVFLDFTDEDWATLKERNDGDEAKALRELSAISQQHMIKQGIEQYKSTLSDQDRALYEAKEKGVPVDAYGIAKHNLDKYSKIKTEDLAENEKLQIDIVSKGYELRGFSKEEIAEEVENLKVLEKLESRAEAVLPLLPKKFKGEIDGMEQAAADADQAQKDKIRQGVAKMKSFVDNTPEIVPGIKLTKPTREKIMRSMTEPIATDVNGNPMNPVMATKARNPQAFETMIHYYHQLGLFNIDEDGVMKPDFSKISKTVKNQTVDSMRGVFEAKEKTVAGKTKVVQTIEEEEDEFGKAFGRIK